jgi:predicted RNA binding protein YcfA (HicA-like mRNA interferase family)
MSFKLPVISGERLIKILVRKGFTVQRQSGEPCGPSEGRCSFLSSSPEELKKGTLKAILNQAGLSVEDLLK